MTRDGVLTPDGHAFELGFAGVGTNRQDSGVTVGAIWFFTPNVKTFVNVDRVVFSGFPDGGHRVEHAVLLRLQLND